MSISRRKFLKTAPAAAGMVLLVKEAALGQKIGRLPRLGSPSNDVLSRLTWISFFPYVNTDFAFRDKAERVVTLRLTDMADAKPKDYVAASPSEECFFMTFTGSVKIGLAQGTYSVEHFALGKFDLFVTSLGQTRKSALYSVVINRLIH